MISFSKITQIGALSLGILASPTPTQSEKLTKHTQEYLEDIVTHSSQEGKTSSFFRRLYGLMEQDHRKQESKIQNPSFPQESLFSLDGNQYDLSKLYQKVFRPVQYLTQRNNTDIMLQLALSEHTGSPTVGDLKSGLQNFSGDNYLKKINIQSEKGAEGIFQIMPKTKEYIKNLSNLDGLIQKHKTTLQHLFGLSSEKDFSILEDALTCHYIIEFNKNTLKKKENINSFEDHNTAIAAMYNAGPAILSLTTIPEETKVYISKFGFTRSALIGSFQK